MYGTHLFCIKHIFFALTKSELFAHFSHIHISTSTLCHASHNNHRFMLSEKVHIELIHTTQRVTYKLNNLRHINTLQELTKYFLPTRL